MRPCDASLGGLVLVTRPEPGASATAARLRHSGYRPVIAPLLAVRPCRVALPRPGGLQAVLAASGNAVALPPAYHAVPLLAVGEATASRARAAGFAEVHAAGGDAVALAELAVRLLRPAAGPLLLAAGKGQGTRLARALRRHGFDVRRRAVYAATALSRFPPEAAEAIRKGLRAALFFSAATARAFARLLPPGLWPLLCRTDAVAIGPHVADTVRHLPWRTLRVAVRPTQDGMLAQL